MAVANTLVLPGVPAATLTRRVFEQLADLQVWAARGGDQCGLLLCATLKMTGSTLARAAVGKSIGAVIVRAERKNLFARCAEHAAR